MSEIMEPGFKSTFHTQFESEAASISQTNSLKMKQIVKAIHDYLETRREEFARTINLHLQSLSVTIDTSIFDPHTIMASQFYKNLYELMKTMEPSASFAWKCVEVLTNACRNSAARESLIHIYQFVPCLARLLGPHLKLERRLDLLKLMQSLTCGIKITWQIPHLPHLMTTLNKWIVASEINEEVVSISLAIIVNLCYNNLPAVYTLMKHVDVKKLLAACLQLNNEKTKLHTAQLFIILEDDDAYETQLVVLSKATFGLITQTLKEKDSFLMQQMIDFFIDLGRCKHFNEMLQKLNLKEQVSSIIQVIDNNSMETGDNRFELDPACIASVFKLFNFLISINLPLMNSLNPIIITLTLKWIHTDIVSVSALSIIKAIALNSRQDEILTPLAELLPFFLTGLNFTLDKNTSLEDINKTSSQLELLTAMAKVSTLKLKIIQDLNVAKLEKLFDDMINNGGAKFGTVDTIRLYTFAIAFACELSKSNPEWLKFFRTLVQHKEVHSILAQYLFESSQDGKNIVLCVALNPNFPTSIFAEALQLVQPSTTNHIVQKQHEINFPVLSISQIRALDGILKKFKDRFDTNPDMCILTSDLMELYEYKVASFANSERNAMTDVAAASERCSHLQHRIATLTTELIGSHQILIRTQQNNEHNLKIKDSLSEEIKKMRHEMELHQNKRHFLKHELITKDEEINDLKKTLERLDKDRDELKNDNLKLRDVVNKLEESAYKLERANLEKKEALLKLNTKVDSLNETIQNFKLNLHQTQNELEQKTSQLIVVTEELNSKKSIIDTITKLL